MNDENLKPFKRGQSGNPKGKPPLSFEEKLIKKTAREDIQEIADLIVSDDLQGLKDLQKKIKNGKGIKVITALLASVAIKILERGDMESLDKFLNRLVGKVRDETHLTGDGTAFEVIVRDYRGEK